MVLCQTRCSVCRIHDKNVALPVLRNPHSIMGLGGLVQLALLLQWRH
jgi:hypothetical protein